MFYWETSGPAFHVDVTLPRITYLSIVADHVHPFMETVFPDGCGLFQQDNARCHKAKMVQEWFDKHNNEFEDFPRSQSNRASVRCVGQTTIGRLCEKCDGKCVICDSYVRPCTLVRICDECNYGSYQGRCVICGGPGVSDAYYCKECTIQEKDRDGCPKIVNLGSSKTDLFYERKKYGFKKR
ncbi:hypothetical protein QTP70_012853 [Hemibagrus guttatus]|uniref:PHD finger-like domain-containing protein 5A n=1 Tax=Hemibagrus guttatus TaxID=175788 RepID=A0AAE0QQB6_9TELE|nr:hypothetical protein QTP70_012853 [Hemibagrus guttatus]